MKTSPRISHSRRTDPLRRAQLLALFDRSGLSAAAFARQHQLHYTTFCGWRQQRAKPKSAPASPGRPLKPGFVQVELANPPAAPSGLIVELDGGARLRIESAAQIALATQLLQTLNAPRPC